jgi:hypothetical protein
MKRSAGLKTFMKKRTKSFHYTVPGHTGIRIRKHVSGQQLIKIKGKSPGLLKKLLRIIRV